MSRSLSDLCIYYYLLEVLTSPVVLLSKKKSVSRTGFVAETSYFFDYKTLGKVRMKDPILQYYFVRRMKFVKAFADVSKYQLCFIMAPRST